MVSGRTNLLKVGDHVDLESSQVNDLELRVVVRVNSDAAGTPVDPAGRVSNPASCGEVLVARLASEMVIDPPVDTRASNCRNWSLPGVEVSTT